MTTLEATTEALRKRIEEHDRNEREASQRRGSVPPPAPPVALTPERVEQIGKALLLAANIISAFSGDAKVSPAEMLAYHQAAKRGVR